MLLEKKYLKNNKFIFACNGLSFSFSKISNLTNNIDLDTILEGGYNNGPRILTKQQSKEGKILLEQGTRRDLNSNVLLKLGMPVYIGTVMVMSGGIPIKVFGFTQGLITKYEIGDLDALRNDILIRKMEISHTGLYEVV